MRKPDKKGQLTNLLSMLLVGGITLTVIVITLAIGVDITQDIQDTQGLYNFPTNNNTNLVDNVTGFGLQGLANVSGQLGLIGTVIALSVVLLILIVLLFRNFGGGLKI